WSSTMAWQAFLSYSRQQYYLAEALALKLQAADISLWFDVQQLEPGTDWQQDIADGLAQSSAVVLLASPEAVRSPYVEREWRAAIDAGKPVLVARCGRTRLPRELRNAPIIDMGGDFTAAASALKTAIANPNRLAEASRGSKRLPPGVARMALALTLRDVQNILVRLLISLAILSLIFYGSLARYLMFALNMQDNPFWIIILAVAAVVLVAGKPEPLRMPSFLRHQFDYGFLTRMPMISSGILVWLWLIIASGWIDFVRQFFDPRGILPASPALLVFIALGLVLAWLINPLYRRIAPAHPNADIVRWATLGRVPAQWRTQVLRAQGHTVSPKRAANGSLNLHIVSEADDQDVLKPLLPIIEQIGGAIVADDQPADTALIILNHNTSRRRVLAALSQHQRVLGVLTARCNLPKELMALTRLQLIDFSDRDAEALYAQLGLMTAQDDRERSGLQTYLDPVSLRRLPAPAMVAYLTVVLLALALVCLLLPPVLLLNQPLDDGVRLGVAAGFGLLGCVLLLAFVQAQRGRALGGRALFIGGLACLPLVLAIGARLELPLPPNLPGTLIEIFPRGWGHTLVSAALLAAATLSLLALAPHMLARTRDALGMPALSFLPQFAQALVVIVVLHLLALTLVPP
ncbi:MAG: toll/interleukin-1 receptor domain-containing protein, partial [Anaerolineae bacterium]|nr:toll/interleukin-1 receptor domain-containing protein [Anaerolineae bacterium]